MEDEEEEEEEEEEDPVDNEQFEEEENDAGFSFSPSLVIGGERGLTDRLAGLTGVMGVTGVMGFFFVKNVVKEDGDPFFLSFPSDNDIDSEREGEREGERGYSSSSGAISVIMYSSAGPNADCNMSMSSVNTSMEKSTG